MIAPGPHLKVQASLIPILQPHVLFQPHRQLSTRGWRPKGEARNIERKYGKEKEEGSQRRQMSANKEETHITPSNRTLIPYLHAY
jgi:hypothetical protein